MAGWWEDRSSRRTALRRLATGTAALTIGGDVATAATGRDTARAAVDRSATGRAATGRITDGPGTEAARAAIDRLAAPVARLVVLAREAAEPEPTAAAEPTAPANPARPTPPTEPTEPTGFPAAAPESFAIEPVDGRVLITATTQVALVSGFHHYLGVIADGHLSRVGDHLPQDVPTDFAPVRKQSPHRDRYLYNFCVNGYTTPYWTWPEWERELDLIAAYGVNRALVTTGAEQLWIDTFVQFGYTAEEVRGWVSAFSVQPWQHLANLAAVGPAPSRRQLDARVALGQRIVARMRELGIEPVLPGYAGMVPPGFAGRNPGANVVPQGSWGAYPRPDWLATDTGLYAEVAAAYYRAQRTRFGRCPWQAVDLLHEGGRPGGVPPAAAGRGVAAALRSAFGPGYRWVIQGWGDNPRKAVLDAVDRSRLLVLDLRAEYRGKWKDEQWQGNPFSGAPWALGTLAGFGGRPGLYGGCGDLLARVPATLTAPDRGRLTGLAVTLEGVQNHALIQSALAGLAWEAEPRALDDWLPGYVAGRYGVADPDALAAWRRLAGSVYRGWAGWPGGPDSLFNAAPSLDAHRASPGAPEDVPYDPAEVGRALDRLLRAGDRVKATETYRYDVLDVARQVLVNHGRTLLSRLRRAYRDRDRPAFRLLAERFLDTGWLADAVLGTRREFLLEPWLAQAERWGATPAERAAMRSDAARLITEWGDRPGPGHVADYANRDWHGLLATYYLPRWRRYLDAVTRNLADGTPIPAFDWFAEGKRWFDHPPRTAAAPTGDPVRAAARVAKAVRTW